MPAKLNQIVAIEHATKPRAYAEITALNKLIQQESGFFGLSRIYQPIADDGVKLPSESKRVSVRMEEIASRIERTYSEWYAVAARKDWTNQKANADIKIGDRVLLPGVPVTFLLFLEKQLTDLRALMNRAPILPEDENWKWDNAISLWVSEPVSTHRTDKVQMPITLYPATDKHPAQTQMVVKDVLVGHWSTIKQSGAMSREEKDKVLERIQVLIDAVKVARVEANMVEEIKPPNVGEAIFGFLMTDMAV